VEARAEGGVPEVRLLKEDTFVKATLPDEEKGPEAKVWLVVPMGFLIGGSETDGLTVATYFFDSVLARLTVVSEAATSLLRFAFKGEIFFNCDKWRSPSSSLKSGSC